MARLQERLLHPAKCNKCKRAPCVAAEFPPPPFLWHHEEDVRKGVGIECMRYYAYRGAADSLYGLASRLKRLPSCVRSTIDSKWNTRINILVPAL